MDGQLCWRVRWCFYGLGCPGQHGSLVFTVASPERRISVVLRARVCREWSSDEC